MRFNFWIIAITATVLFTAGYFLFNPSYERSLEAKFYYVVGDYHQSYRLASEAFELNAYNRMASTIMTQSQTAMKFVDYIKEAKSYMAKISKTAQSEGVSDAERARIKMMCEIMIESYEKISATVVTDKALVEEATMYRDKFKKLHHEIAK